MQNKSRNNGFIPKRRKLWSEHFILLQKLNKNMPKQQRIDAYLDSETYDDEDSDEAEEFYRERIRRATT